jgi:AraC-like DNA-binding protein
MGQIAPYARCPGKADNGATTEELLARSGRREIEQRRIVSRFKYFLAARWHERIGLAEICAAIGVSERKLRHCCGEVLGTSPIQYLWLQRMYLARLSLLTADPSTRTVTEIAIEYGFSELGRFSVDYRSLFGESPSVTLRER